MRRVSIVVPEVETEEMRAQLLELFPGGFEEIDRNGSVELVAYTDRNGESLLARRFNGVSACDVAPGWEERWREFHRPVSVGRLWIGRSWQTRSAGFVDVVIDPGRAFGTGSHASTRLCLELLQQLPPAALLDVGCGSGVIAIAAAKLGFAPVTAVDIDEHAVDATLRNAAVNGVAVDALRADARTEDLPPADIVVANVTRELVEQIAPRLECRVLVAAGYLAEGELRLPEFHAVKRLEDDGWAADLFERVAQ